MQQLEILMPDQFYHVYNHAVGGRNLFQEEGNYEHFLQLYDKYISTIAETFAWVLMPNHFHFLIKIKNDVIENPLQPSLQFSKLFNSYAQSFNKRFGSRGSLFERPFKRKLIDSFEYLRKVILYIHNNPVHHGFCSHPIEYPWTSYLDIVSITPTKLKRDQVVGWFDSEANFKFLHETKVEVEKIEDWLEINRCMKP